VAYPGWAGDRTDRINRDFRRALVAADRVLYQSEFCKRSADTFLGEPRGSWEVLYNAVDVDLFTPSELPPAEGPVLLLAGDQTQAYRLDVALHTLAHLPDARLIVTGRLVSDPDPLLRERPGVQVHRRPLDARPADVDAENHAPSLVAGTGIPGPNPTTVEGQRMRVASSRSTSVPR